MTHDPLDALRLPSLPIEPRQEFADGLWQRISGAELPLAGSAFVGQVQRPAGCRQARQTFSTVSSGGSPPFDSPSDILPREATKRVPSSAAA